MIELALKSIRPNAQWSLNGDDYSGLDWLDKNQNKPTEAEVSKWILENEEIVIIETRLNALDFKLPRHIEDLIKESGNELFGDIRKTLESKIEARSALRKLLDK